MQPDIIYTNVMLTFEPRNKVWKRNKVLSDRSTDFTAKLEPKYASPCIVEKKISFSVFVKGYGRIRCW
jgi:hypothetical protein